MSDIVTAKHMGEAAAVITGAVMGAYSTGSIQGAIAGAVIAGAAAYEAGERDGKDVIDAVDTIGGKGTFHKAETAVHCEGHLTEVVAVAAGAAAGLCCSGTLNGAMAGAVAARAVSYELVEHNDALCGKSEFDKVNVEDQ